jgi:polysaccharide chain length determinant protein (PEP-CTERM system associated)
MNATRTQSANLAYYMMLVSRHRWILIASFGLAVSVGIVMAVALPKMYEATTLILVQPQRVPEKIVTPVVDADIEFRIGTISQQILSRSNLEKIIERFNLFSKGDEREQLMEAKVESLRKRIKVEVSQTRNRRTTEAFSISFKDHEPKSAMDVANGLATFFIDENIKSREGVATGTSDFLEAELETSRKRLEEQEQLLKKFREKNMGELPEQLDSNLKILERLNLQLSQKEESLRSARVTLAAIESEMSIRQGAIAAMAPPAVPVVSGRENEDQVSLEQLKEKLDGLRSSYTDQHPDVMRLKARIERLEKEHPSAPPAPDRAVDSGGATRRYASAQLSAEAVRQKAVQAGAIRALEVEITRINQETRDYQRRVEATPRREQELLTIKRDYDNVRASYSSLLNKKLEADMAVNMEKKQKGEQFQILDPARMPERPTSPDMMRLFAITLIAGLGLGGGLLFLIDMLDGTVRRLDTLEEDVGVPVLATVPRIFNSKDKRMHHVRRTATAISVVFLVALTAVLAVLVFNGVETTLELVKHYARA